ncbi:MaoC dehydratase-like protein [Blastococcus colisei]|uniref:MaoC dehydratase-like protein n=2 Tax=Blastococcus colisei TaxID=1564162 RepID=A0A543PG98_9ACTN|nr:MaoC dehydratase-like protein [Blastococcus colisei]
MERGERGRIMSGDLFEQTYERAKAVVGQVHQLPLGRMSKKEFQRFAYACGDVSPRYVDDDAARAEGFPEAVAPPLFLSGVMGWEPGPAEEDLRPDGTGKSETVGLPLEGLRLMGAGQDIELHHDVVDGMDIVAHISLDGVDLKQGRSGTLLLVRVLRRYVDGEGREVLTCRESFIAR